MPVVAVPIAQTLISADCSVQRSRSVRIRVTGLFACCLMSAATVAAADGMDLTCKPPAAIGVGVVPQSRQVAESIVCRYRLHNPASTERALATLDGQPVAGQHDPDVASAAPSSAVLFAIDLSSWRAARLEHLNVLADAGAPGHRFALASFGGELDISAPFGSNAAQIKQAAARLRRARRPTEFYRSALKATRVLAREETERKALVLFSDGLAEDRAYFHQDVVDAARAGGVVIYGIGYPRSLMDSVALQSLRRLADETGGRFVAANTRGILPATFLDAPYEVLDNVGEVRIPRPDKGWPTGTNPRRLSLELITASGKARATAALTFPPPAGSQTASPEAPDRQPAGPFDALAGVGNERTLMLGLVIAGLLGVLLGASATWMRARRAKTQDAAASGTQEQNVGDASKAGVLTGATDIDDTGMETDEDDGIGASLSARARQRPRTGAQQQSGTRSAGDTSNRKSGNGALANKTSVGRGAIAPLPAAMAVEQVPVNESAFLERVGEDGDPFSIHTSPLGIGRQSDNDVVLKDPSISRHHAVVERRGPGEYVIRDLGALNGVLVNHMRKPEVTLKDGDLIELGDMAIKFTLEVDEGRLVVEPESEQSTMILQGGFGTGTNGSGLSLASFRDTDEEDSFDFLRDDPDEFDRS